MSYNFPGEVDPLLVISMGAKSGYSLQNKFGENEGVGTTKEDVWLNGGTLSYLSSAETMEIASTDVDDTNSSGSGARTVEIFGLDGSYLEINETVNLNGTTDVTTSNSYLRVHRMIVRSAGATGSNEGIISATATTAGTVQATIGVGFNQTLQTNYTVPAAKYAFLIDGKAGCQRADQAIIQLEARQEGEVFAVKYVLDLYQQTVFIPQNYLRVPPKTDLKVTARRIGGAGDIRVSAEYDFVLVDSSLVT